MALHVYIDADACPVKQEVYRVAERYKLSVTLVANSHMRIPYYPWLKLIVVGDDLDEVDNWIAERVGQSDIVITADIPLADRCVKAGARVLSPAGKEFTEDNIGGALAIRNLMADLRDAGTLPVGGPPPFSRRDHSRFLQRLDRVINMLQQEQAGGR
jgi:uncharacterized protein YaiI (UPF0178 family)